MGRKRLDQLTDNESGFAFRELRHGRLKGYHRMTCEHPLACYAPEHPEDTATWMQDVTGEFRPVTTAECDSIIERNINWHMHKKGLSVSDVARAFDFSSDTIASKLKRPSAMTREQAGKLCSLLDVNLDQLIYRDSIDLDTSSPLPEDKLARIYRYLTEKHRRMVSELVWELFDTEQAHAEVDFLQRDLLELAEDWPPADAATIRQEA